MSDEAREVREGASAGTVVLAFLCGALVGAAVGLFLAPRAGAETRERLAGAAGSAGERARRAREAARIAADAASKAFQEAMWPPAPPAA
jgi:gas vesicle protein